MARRKSNQSPANQSGQNGQQDQGQHLSAQVVLSANCDRHDCPPREDIEDAGALNILVENAVPESKSSESTVPV